MSNHEQLKELIIRYHQGKCSSKELELLRSLLLNPDNQYILEEIYDDLPEESAAHLLTNKEDLYRQIVNDSRVISHNKEGSSTTTKIRFIKKPWMVAAAIIIILALPFIYYQNIFDVKIVQRTQTDSLQYVIVPGGDRAHIVLEDGRLINLEQIAGDTIIYEKGFSIVKNNDGSVYYKYDQQKAVDRQTAYNTIITPKGGQYQITLSDGTNVWLNAESSLRYPIFFDGDLRQVELKGEGYFEVAKNVKGGRSIPFIVQAGNQKLEVLGTIFNIDSYNRQIKTTLVEGKVRLGSLDNQGQRVVLKPHEQSVFSDENRTFAVSPVDPLYATAWKNGNFSFHRATIHEVMESISRWYDVEIDYRNTFSNDYFTGTISRFEQIDKLLKSIELTGSVHFKIEGRRLIVDR